MIQSDFDHIALGIRDSLIKAAVAPLCTKAQLEVIRLHQVSVLTVAKNIAARMGASHPEFVLEDFVDECAMVLGSDGVWRVPDDGPYYPAP